MAFQTSTLDAPQYLPDRACSVVAATQQGHFALGPAGGIHLHAVTADRRRGGHVLRARVGPGTLRFATLTRPCDELRHNAPRST
jgi:hypothetical protein